MVSRRVTLSHLLRLIREPVPAEKRALLRRRWESLDPRWRSMTQGYGRKATGCGATVGIQPRCDFDCKSCYLGEGANRARPLGLDAIRRQLDRLRAYLGPKGNVQITDGEVTLLPPTDLIAILRHARSIDLIPMVMTHGDTFRRRPDLLPRLVREGGLTEVAIHVDATQRGRVGYREGADELDLMPLREEFAGLIRKVRSETGVRLRGAMTLTVSADNLEAVPTVVDWCLRNRDAFGLLSFQPLARVGRTRPSLIGVGVDALWRRIARALAPYGLEREGQGPFLFGHPDCNRLELLGVHQRRGEPPRVMPVLRDGHPEDERIAEEFLARGLGGINFRDDKLPARICRALGVLLTDPRWFLGPVRRWTSERAAVLGGGLAALAWGLLRGAARLDSFAISSHHFMSRDEIGTPVGRERLEACVFRVPLAGRMVPMCEVNLAGGREAVYARSGAAAEPSRPRLEAVGE